MVSPFFIFNKKPINDGLRREALERAELQAVHQGDRSGGVRALWC